MQPYVADASSPHRSRGEGSNQRELAHLAQNRIKALTQSTRLNIGAVAPLRHLDDTEIRRCAM